MGQAAAVEHTIVVGIDFTEASEHALRQAAAFAQRWSSTVVQLLHVVDASGAERPEETPERMRRWLRDRSHVLTPLRGHAIGMHVRVGQAADAIVAFAREVNADLVVVGSHGRKGLKERLLGSVADKVVEKSSCPVVVATPSQSSATAIEPPCPQCLEARRASHGARWWCAHHEQGHVRAHAWSYQRELPTNYPDADVIPTGVHSARS